MPLILFPINTERMSLVSANVSLPKQTRTGFSSISYLSIVLTLFLLFGGAYKLSSKYKKTNKNKFQEGKFNIPGFLAKVPGKNTGSEMRPGFGNIGELFP